MAEQEVFAAVLSDRGAFEQVQHHIDLDELSPQGKAWWPLIKEWYKTDRRAQSVDRLSVRGRGEHTMPDKHLTTLLGWYDHLPTEVSPGNVVKDLLDMKRFSVGNHLCAAIQGKDTGKIEPLLDNYTGLLTATKLGKSEIRWTEDDDEMHARLDRENLIKLAPAALNAKCKGGAGRGDHLVIFGRPESGKTLFTVNMVGGFLKFGHKVLYVGNEEDTYKTRKRIICNLSGATTDQYEEEPDRALALAKERGLDKLRICHLNPGSIPEIEELVKEVRPDVLILDQIRNISWSGKGGESMVTKLEQLGIAVRALLGRYDMLGVSITQARDSESPDAWLRMEDMDNTRTGLPGQADAIFGVGVDDGLIATNQRAISMCKNKLNDDPDGRVGFMVQVDPARSKVR